MQVIGTAGHVDHGKSSLVKRLTGINTDRLKEEQDRNLSIDLGFAWIRLPDGHEIGIVDVPGHRDFIENMLAGVGGIDAVLFVVAADEGVMPQTSEHLAIVDLLQIPAGVVALTKIDLIEDADWLDLVEEDLREALKGTILEKAPIVRVSAKTGQGIDMLVDALQKIYQEYPHRPDLDRPRLPVDRVFTLPGFGTILTGTLLDGQFSVGDVVEILPQGVKSRIRGLQAHKQAEQKALPGGRTAVNVSGVGVDEVFRGNVLVHPGDYQTTKMIDVFCKILPDASAPLKHNSEVKLFIGSAEVMARVRVLGTHECPPGGEAFLQLMLQKSLVTVRGDRFILRRPSPPATIGGGQVLDAHPERRHRRFNKERLETLEQLLMGTPEDILLQTALKLGVTSLKKLIEQSGLEKELAESIAEEMIKSGELLLVKADHLIIPRVSFNRIKEDVINKLEKYHQQYPLRIGMPREVLKSQIALNSKDFDNILSFLTSEGLLVEAGTTLWASGHKIRFSSEQKVKIDGLLKDFEAQPYTPPSYKQSQEMIGEELLAALIALEELVWVAEDVLFLPKVIDEMKQAVINHIQQKGSITLAELRDQFDTSRRYAVAVLEYLDKVGITVRRGDVRILMKNFPT